MEFGNFLYPSIPAAIINAFNLGITLWVSIRMAIYGRAALSQDERDVQILQAKAGEASDRESILAIEGALQSGGILARRLNRLRRTADRGGAIDQAGLAGATIAELDNVLAFPRYWASTAVLLGLAGTLIGLMLAVGHAESMLRSGPDAIAEVLGSFGSLSMAFSNTLVGVFCTIVVGVGITEVRKRQTRYLLVLEDVTGGNVLPWFQPSPSTALAQAASALMSMQSELKVGMTRLLDGLSASGARLLDQVESQINGLTIAVRERGVALTSTVDVTMAQLIDDLRRLLSEYQDANRQISTLLGVPTSEFRPLVHSVDTLRGAADAAAAAAVSVEHLIPTLSEALERQADRQSRDLHEGLSNYVKSIAGALQQHQAVLDEAVKASAKQASDAVSRSVSELASPIQALARVHEEYRGMLAEWRDAIRRMGRSNGEPPSSAPISSDLPKDPTVGPRPVSSSRAAPSPLDAGNERDTPVHPPEGQPRGLFARFFGGGK